MNVLTKVAFFNAKPGHSEALGARLRALVEPTRSELGCLRYDIHRSDEDSNLWFVYENWFAQADFDAHMRTPYVQAFMADVPELCADGITIHTGHRLTPDTDPR